MTRNRNADRPDGQGPPDPPGLPALLGESAGFQAFRDRLRRAAASSANVLLIGESGAGKSLAARHLHAASARSAGPLVTVPLGALPAGLVESELFGHVEGAFTGAARARRGRFRAAEGGTLVLDDVAALPRDQQGRLLRALQERSIEPLGAEASVPVDVRVVATAQRDLAADVAAGTLREDLYYRLSVVDLVVPPLRARKEDLPELAAALVARIAARLGLAPRHLDGAALERLAVHDWPGNVRELENVLERALVLGSHAADAPLTADQLELGAAPRSAARDLAQRALESGLTLAEFETALLRAALEAEEGNHTAAARRVGLTRRAFEYRTRRQAEER